MVLDVYVRVYIHIYMRVYVVRIIHNACASNRSRELYHPCYMYQYKHIHSTEVALRNDFGFC